MRKDKEASLENEILKHKNLYYQGKPEISDTEYDQMEEELRSLNPDNYVLSLVGARLEGLDKVEHDKKMLSLQKTYKEEELIKWMGEHELVSTFKIDGMSCSLIFEDGKLTMAKTRGDGKRGENVTQKILWIAEVPKTIKTKAKKIEIRGEVFCTEESFYQLAQQMEQLDLEAPSSQRNIVAGLMGRKDHINLSKYLSFQAFEVVEALDNNIKTEVSMFKQLNEWGFETPNFTHHKTTTTIQVVLNEASEFLSTGNYLIDGVVFTYNDISLHDEMGATAHHPRYKMAFKFQGAVAGTKIQSIEWGVSRNGVLTPVAHVEPVELSGAKIGKVTLHNFGMVEQNQLKSGDEIEIVRSGEVIPKFLRVLKASNEKFEYPNHCPSCGTKLDIEDIRLICPNIACPAVILEKILNFVQKIGIDDLSKKRLEEFVRAGIIKSISDLYDIKPEALLGLEKFKEKLATKIVGSIQNSKNVDLITFLSALGLTGGAYNKCEKIVNAGFDSIDKILTLKIEQLIEVDSFAEKSSTEIVRSIEENRNLILELVAKGFVFNSEDRVEGEKSLMGQKFCITGTLSSKRSEVEKLIKNAGGQTASSVTSKTNYLVTNDTESSSSKFKKAKELNIPIISEENLREMIDG